MGLFQSTGESSAQLTVRSVLLGSAMGFGLSMMNVYVGLKLPVHVGVNLTACILAFGVWTGVRRAGLARSSLSILETTCAVSVASSGGYATGNTLVSAFPAMAILSPDAHPSILVTGVWILLVAAFGVVVAIPMKRTMLDRDNLPFPSGTAAATMIESLHGSAAERVAKVRALVASALVSGVLKLLTSYRAKSGSTPVPETSNVFDGFGAIFPGKLHASDFGIVLPHALMPFGVGILAGLRVTASMVAGAAIGIALTPTGLAWVWQGPEKAIPAVANPAGASGGVGLWLGASILVAGSLTGVVLRWRALAEGVAALRAGSSGSTDAKDDDVPLSWFVYGCGLAGGGLIVGGRIIFQIPIALGALAVVMALVLAAAACRTVGETDTAPSGPLAKVAQVAFGAFRPDQALGNLQAASITAGSAIASADLLSDLRTGQKLGASPRRQFVAQAIGIVSGTLGSVGAYALLVDVRSLASNSASWPPSAKTWVAVAKVLKHGVAGLHPMWRYAIIAGIIAGIAITAGEHVAGARKKYLPSATGVGFGLIVPFAFVLPLFAGGLFAAVVTRRRKAWADRYLVVIAAGVIAGEAIFEVITKIASPRP